MTIDVLQFRNREVRIKILVMLDVGEKMIRLHQSVDDTARTAFDALFCRWIPIFGIERFMVVHRVSNLSSFYLNELVSMFSSQLSEIATKARWCTGSNERSDLLLVKIIYTSQLSYSFENKKTIPNFFFQLKWKWVGTVANT